MGLTEANLICYIYNAGLWMRGHAYIQPKTRSKHNFSFPEKSTNFCHISEIIGLSELRVALNCFKTNMF